MINVLTALHYRAMGQWYSKVGSAPFYASVERSLEQLQTDAANLKVRGSHRPPPPSFAQRPPGFLPICPSQLLDTFIGLHRLRQPNDRDGVPRSAALSSSIHAPSSLRSSSMHYG